jgi:polyhydroxybutyrate depolymerase
MKHITLLLLFFHPFVFSQSITIGWIKDIQMEHDGITRYFDVFIPHHLNENPELVIKLHGGTQSKDKIFVDDNIGASKFWEEVAEIHSFLLIVPNGTNLRTGKGTGNRLHWNDCRVQDSSSKTVDDVGFISKIIDWSIEKYKVNNKKVFLTGISNGGMMCYRLAQELPEKITAIGVFVANLPKDSECKTTTISIPTIIINGAKDRIMPFEGGKIKYTNDEVLSSKATIDFFVKKFNYKLNPIDGFMVEPTTGYKHYNYINENNKKMLEYIIVPNAGHNMPGSRYTLTKLVQRIVGKQNHDHEGAELAWDFFKNLSK